MREQRPREVSNVPWVAQHKVGELGQVHCFGHRQERDQGWRLASVDLGLVHQGTAGAYVPVRAHAAGGDPHSLPRPK